MSLKPLYQGREDAAEYIGLSVPTMERMVAAGEFPAPRQLTKKRVGWLTREIDEWGEARPVSSNLPVKNSGIRHPPAGA